MRYVLILKTQCHFFKKPSFLFVIYQMVELQAIMMIDIVEKSNTNFGSEINEYSDLNIIAELNIEWTEYKEILQYMKKYKDTIQI